MDAKETNILGRLVRSARNARGLTLEEVATRVGITAGALSHIESGRRLPEPRNAVAVAEVIGVPTETMLAALDEAHALRRRSVVSESRRPSPVQNHSSLASLSFTESPQAPHDDRPPRAYRSMPIEQLFDGAGNAGSTAPLSQADARQLARWSPDIAQRMDALEELADAASDAIRTLRGLLDDDDPAIAREARRLLRELDVRTEE